MTLDQLRSLDVAAVWAALDPERQAVIGRAALRYAFADLVAEDDGTDTVAADRGEAGVVRDSMLTGIPEAVAPAFPDLAWFEGLVPAWALRQPALDLGRVRVNGYRGRRAVRLQGTETLLIRDGRAWIELAGAHDIAGPDDPADWLFWTVPQVEAERLRRHPEFAVSSSP
jgi:hypothetical protein